MSTRSLGTLTLDLIAKTGGFVQGMDSAERSSQKWRKSVEKDLKAITAGAAATGAAFLALSGIVVRNTMNAEREQAQLAAVLRSTGEAAGFNRDQLNEMAEAIEDVSTISAGEVTEAQTALLAFTGVVGNEFVRAQQAAADMSARTGMSIVQTAETIGRALDVPSQGMAALSRQGFRFSEEQKEVIKYLEETGRSAEAQGIILDALEESYGGAALAARETFGGSLTGLKNTVAGLLTGEDGSLEGARVAVEDLNTALSDPSVKASIDAMMSAAVSGAQALVKTIPFVIDAGDGVVRVFDIAAQTVVGMYATAVGRLSALAAQVFTALSLLPDFAGGDMFSRLAEENRREAELNLNVAAQAAAAIRDTLERPLAGSALLGATDHVKDLNTLKGEGLQLDEAAELAAARRAEAEKKAADAASKAAAKKAEQAQAAIRSEITAIERAAATWGMGADEVKLYGLAVQGATEAQLAHASALLQDIEAFEASKKLQEDYLSLVADLRTEEEKLTDQLHDRLAVLDAIAAAGGIGSDEYQNQAGRAAAGAFKDAPEFGGLAPEVGGPFGELTKIDKAQEELQQWYSTQLEMLEQFRADRADLSEQWDEQEQQLKEAHEAKLADIEQARQQARMAAGEEFFGNMAESAKAFFGENSKLYKAAFAIEKAYAIGKALMNVPKSYSDAFAAVVGIPIIGPALAPAAGVAAATAQVAQAAAIGNINLAGQAHDGIMSIPEDGTWNLKKGERVTTAETSAALDATLADIQSNRSSGAGGVVINMIESRERAGTTQERTTPDGRQEVDVFVSDIYGDGPRSRALQSAFGLTRRGN